METAAPPATTGTDLRVLNSLNSLADLADLVQGGGPVYLRYSCGFEADRGTTSRDGESGPALPGLSVNPLTPEPWWTRPLTDWLARQVCHYRHLAEEQERSPGRSREPAWAAARTASRSSRT